MSNEDCYIDTPEKYRIELAGSSDLYNCIAWAAGDTQRWWWPSLCQYWPNTEDKQGPPEVEKFERMFQNDFGYTRCKTGRHRSGYEKIAIWADYQWDTVTHASRQLRNGKWTSKCGPSFLVMHPCHKGLSTGYGRIVRFMERRIDIGDNIIHKENLDRNHFIDHRSLKISA